MVQAMWSCPSKLMSKRHPQILGGIYVGSTLALIWAWAKSRRALKGSDGLSFANSIEYITPDPGACCAWELADAGY